VLGELGLVAEELRELGMEVEEAEEPELWAEAPLEPGIGAGAPLELRLKAPLWKRWGILGCLDATKRRDQVAPLEVVENVGAAPLEQCDFCQPGPGS